ncbi:hypothetical protein SESBI_37640 [Sesbania bispinosa]|nr:hypothetical protein SESBI_37640 [Sesbania bispinosa]
MSFISKAIAPWCKKYENIDDGVDGYKYNYPPTTFYGDGDYSFVPAVATMEGDDDDDDGGYDYAPAA